MKEIVRTNDPVLVSFITHLLKQAGCAPVVADENISVMEGSIGAFPRRILVASDRHERAKEVLRDAELGQWIVSPKP